MKYLRFLFTLGSLVASEYAIALDFEVSDDINPSESDEQMFIGQPLDEKSPEIEIDQTDLREMRPHAAGLAIGEAIPGASHLLSYLGIQDNQNAYLVSLGKGKGTSSEQSDGENSFVNTYQAFLLDGSWLWWPVPQFPFAIQTGATLATIRGKVKETIGASGSYNLAWLGLGTGLVMESYFENGIWLHWNLISGRYTKILKGKYEGMTDKQKSSAAHNIDGFQIVGVANLTVGYSW